MEVSIRVSPGDLCDRLIIIRLKIAHCPASQAEALQRQLSAYEEVLADLPRKAGFAGLMTLLTRCNKILWRLEDRIRDRRSANDHNLVATARLIARVNDRRAETKQEIDHLFDAELGDRKIYGRQPQS